MTDNALHSPAITYPEGLPVSARVDDILAAETFLSFGPDTLAEARNRGYRPARTARG